MTDKASDRPEQVYVTYHAPAGESKMVTMGSKTFYDGQPIECDSVADAELLAQLEGHPQFEVSDHRPHAAGGVAHHRKEDEDPKPGQHDNKRK